MIVSVLYIGSVFIGSVLYICSVFIGNVLNIGSVLIIGSILNIGSVLNIDNGLIICCGLNNGSAFIVGSVLIERANQWLRSNGQFRVKVCESIEVKGRYDGVVDTNKSCYFEADASRRRMRNLYIRALR